MIGQTDYTRESTLTIKQMQNTAYKISDDHGFHEGLEGKHVPTKLLLLIQEATEAFDEIRDGKDLTKNTISEKGKPEGFPSEIADIVIRCGDLASIVGFDLSAAIEEKMRYNQTRPFKHGRTC